MMTEKINNKGQAQLFKNRYMEYLTKTNPLVIWSIYLPVLIIFPFYGLNFIHLPKMTAIVCFLTGVIFWTLVEYVLHRFVFHYQPISEMGKRMNYILHGNHHEFPRDRERLFMPAIPSIIISSCFFFTYYFILGNWSFLFFPGFMLGYLLYGSMHYAIHAYNPPFKWMKGLWRNHHLHHYKHANAGFGVSSTLWDHIFGTMYSKVKL